jgi:hypothetical protein
MNSLLHRVLFPFSANMPASAIRRSINSQKHHMIFQFGLHFPSVFLQIEYHKIWKLSVTYLCQFYLSYLSPLAGSHPELIWNYGSHRQLVGLLDEWSALSQGYYIHRKTQTEKKCGQTSIPPVGFEPMIPAFELAKTFHALDSVAIVISIYVNWKYNYISII